MGLAGVTFFFHTQSYLIAEFLSVNFPEELNRLTLPGARFRITPFHNGEHSSNEHSCLSTSLLLSLQICL